MNSVRNETNDGQTSSDGLKSKFNYYRLLNKFACYEWTWQVNFISIVYCCTI